MAPIGLKSPRSDAKAMKKVKMTMHSEIHTLAAEISELCGEKHLFARYLGAIKRVGKDKAYYLKSLLKDPRSNINHKGKWFMWQTRAKPYAKN